MPTLLAYDANARLSLGKQGPPNPKPYFKYFLPIRLSEPIDFYTLSISSSIPDSVRTCPSIFA